MSNNVKAALMTAGYVLAAVAFVAIVLAFISAFGPEGIFVLVMAVAGVMLIALVFMACLDSIEMEQRHTSLYGPKFNKMTEEERYAAWSDQYHDVLGQRHYGYWWDRSESIGRPENWKSNR